MKPSWQGKLEVVAGPMFSSKSTRLLQSAYWTRDHLKRNILVLKPAIDSRYSSSEIVTHDGVRISATPVSAWPEIVDDIAHVYIDETQFFERPFFDGDLPTEVRGLLHRGIDVTAAGLDMDWRGMPFRVMAELLAMADEITKVKAICAVCHAPASKNFKLTPNEKQVEIGAGDLYQARCNQHWHNHAAA